MSAPYCIGVGIAGTRACVVVERDGRRFTVCLLYTSPSPRD